MSNFFARLKFRFQKPKVVMVAGRGRALATEAIFQVLTQHFKVGKEILIFQTESNDTGVEKFGYLLRHSSLPILVITHSGDITLDTEEIKELAKMMPKTGFLVLNFDDETVKAIEDETNLNEITFGFQERADFQATDVKLNGGTNFKINHKGNIVPVWLDKIFGKEQIYSALAAAAVGTVFGLNLVQISQALKKYQAVEKIFQFDTRNNGPIV